MERNGWRWCIAATAGRARLPWLAASLLFLLALPAARAQLIVIDNVAGQSPHAFTQIGSWSRVSTPAGFRGEDHLVAAAGATATAARWRPSITTAGTYKLYLRWAAADDRTERAEIEIHYEGGTKVDATRRLNQRVNGGVWVYLGTYHFSAGTGNSILIRSSDGGSVSADAALFELANASTVPPPYPAPSTPRAEYNNPDWRLNPAEVTIVRTDSADPGVSAVFDLRVNGQSYTIRGVCGHEAVAPIAAAGGNTLRLYSINPLGDVSAYLQAASDAGLKVIVGLFFTAADPGPNQNFYDDPAKVEAQFQAFKAQVNAYRHHEAILAWNIGNEIDPVTVPNPEPLYRAVDQLARYIREVDHYHPALTAHAGSHQSKIAGVVKWAPHIDILGVNSYERNLPNVLPNALAAGWTGPFVITEWSIAQPQQARAAFGEITSFGSVIEPVSAEKYLRFRAIYDTHFRTSAGGRCLGGFVFKGAMGAFRITHTWYPLLDANFRPTPSFDAMRESWGGPPAGFTAPRVTRITINGLEPSASVTVSGSFESAVEVTADPGAELEYRVEVRPEVPMSSNTPPSPVAGLIATPVPGQPGRFLIETNGLVPDSAYRLFYEVRLKDPDDPLGYRAVGTANIPFLVTAGGTTVAEYLFDQGNFANTANSPLAAASTMANAAGASVSGTTFSVFQTNAGNAIPESLEAAIAEHHYLGFTVTPLAGPIDFERLGFLVGASNATGSGNPDYTVFWAVMSSATGFSPDRVLATGEFSATAINSIAPRWAANPPSLWLTGQPALQQVTTPTEFRIYYWDNLNTPTGNLIARFDSVSLSATASRPGLAAWRAAVFPPADRADNARSGPDADPDGDGLPNLLEYALGRNPLAAEPFPPLVLAASPSGWSVDFVRPAGRSDIAYTVEASSDLRTWSAGGLVPQPISADAFRETWRVELPLPASGPLFLRLRVDLLDETEPE